MEEPAEVDPTRPAVPDAVRVQILATEHWSLLATRQLAWSEAFSRTSIFLTVVSAAVVALALVAQTDNEGNFTLFALVLLPAVLLLGIATFVRLGTINEEDSRLVIGMNRLRRGYLEMAPDLEQYFVTDSYDDAAGLARTMALNDVIGRTIPPLQVLASTPVIVGILDAVIAGVLSDIAVQAAGVAARTAFGVGALSGVVMLGLLALVPARQISHWFRTYIPRFPREPAA